MVKRLVGLLGGGDVHERVRVGNDVYSPLMGKSFCKAALACLVVGMYMNLCRLEMTWVPTRVKRPKLRQSTQRIEMGGQYSSFSGSSCTSDIALYLVPTRAYMALMMSNNVFSLCAIFLQ